MNNKSYVTTLDAGDAPYPHLTAGAAVWAPMEGSGPTSAGSSGNGNTPALDTISGHGVAWGGGAMRLNGAGVG